MPRRPGARICTTLTPCGAHTLRTWPIKPTRISSPQCTPAASGAPAASNAALNPPFSTRVALPRGQRRPTPGSAPASGATPCPQVPHLDGARLRPSPPADTRPPSLARCADVVPQCLLPPQSPVRRAVARTLGDSSGFGCPFHPGSAVSAWPHPPTTQSAHVGPFQSTPAIVCRTLYHGFSNHDWHEVAGFDRQVPGPGNDTTPLMQGRLNGTAASRFLQAGHLPFVVHHRDIVIAVGGRPTSLQIDPGTVRPQSEARRTGAARRARRSVGSHRARRSAFVLHRHKWRAPRPGALLTNPAWPARMQTRE